MPRPKSNKKSQSINFEVEVLRALEIFCKKENVLMSTFVNSLVKSVVMSEYEFYRQLTKQHAIEMHKYQMLMDTSLDKPQNG